MYERMGWRVTCLSAWLLSAGTGWAQDAGTTPPGSVSAPAQSQEAEAQTAMSAMDTEARQHFQLGRTFYDSGRFREAAEEFDAAYKLSKRPELLYNIYVAKRDAGELPGAVEALRGYLDQVPDAPDRVNLKARLESLEAQAKRQAEQEALAAEAQKRSEAPRAPEAPRTRKEKQRSVVPFVLIGTGGALGLASVATGVLALNKSKDLDEACGGNECPSSEKSDVDSTKTLAITTDVLWGVGAAAAVTGLVLWLTGALDTEREVPIALELGPTSVGTHLRGRF